MRFYRPAPTPCQAEPGIPERGGGARDPLPKEARRENPEKAADFPPAPAGTGGVRADEILLVAGWSGS